MVVAKKIDLEVRINTNIELSQKRQLYSHKNEPSQPKFFLSCNQCRCMREEENKNDDWGAPIQAYQKNGCRRGAFPEGDIKTAWHIQERRGLVLQESTCRVRQSLRIANQGHFFLGLPFLMYPPKKVRQLCFEHFLKYYDSCFLISSLK